MKIIDLPDSDFAYKNLTSSLVKIYYDDSSFALYRDSTKKYKLYCLDDSLTKERIIVPIIISKDAPFRDSAYIVHYMPGYLVAKQDKIGNLTPVILEVNGDDYGALIYVLLDKNDNPVSDFFLEGGENGGPDIDMDTLILLSPKKVSFIEGNIISSYILHIYIRPRKDTTALYTVDSISYKTIISKDGQIKTSRIDSERYNRAPDKSLF